MELQRSIVQSVLHAHAENTLEAVQGDPSEIANLGFEAPHGFREACLLAIRSMLEDLPMGIEEAGISQDASDYQTEAEAEAAASLDADTVISILRDLEESLRNPETTSDPRA